mgnify:FL=1
MVGGGGAVAEDVSDNEAERAKRNATSGAPSQGPAQGEDPREYDPAQNPEKIVCPKCAKMAERQKSQRSGKFYYFCREHTPEIRLRPGPDGKGVPYA